MAAVAFAYRVSIHESTGFFRYFLMYGREARTPTDLVHRPPLVDPNSSKGNLDFDARHRTFCAGLRVSIAKTCTLLRIDGNTRTIYAQALAVSLSDPGCGILFRDDDRVSATNGSRTSYYEGPFLVVRDMGRKRRNSTARPGQRV